MYAIEKSASIGGSAGVLRRLEGCARRGLIAAPVAVHVRQALASDGDEEEDDRAFNMGRACGASVPNAAELLATAQFAPAEGYVATGWPQSINEDEGLEQ